MRKLGCALVAGIAGAAMLAAAAPAPAEMPLGMVVATKDKFPGSDGMSCTTHAMRGDLRARVCYDGDQSPNGFWVKDLERDGYSAVASWSIPAADGRPNAMSGYCRNRAGAGTWGWCTLFTSGTGRIAFGAGVYDGSAKRDKWPDRFRGWRWEDL